MITRHYVDVREPDGRVARVHYRRAGSGPPLLMVHQSPRSSAEYAPLMMRWAADFTCIAPDTRGFGQSDPLSSPEPASPRPECDDYAAATLAFLDALGLASVAAYGFHSGAIILLSAARRAPFRFSGIACGGYAVWTDAERADFGAAYTPDFRPQPHGEHLAWLWGRLMEQSWFFPWYRTAPNARLPGAHADPERVHAIAMECLSAGNGFSVGYAAVLRASRDIPGPDVVCPAVLIAAYEGDPLAAHLGRLGRLPTNWQAMAVPSPAALEAAALSFLKEHSPPADVPAPPATDAGFVALDAGGFAGLLHWKAGGRLLFIHAPGSSLDGAPAGAMAIDLPGHGLSDPWRAAPARLDDWAAVVVAAVRHLGWQPETVAGAGWCHGLAAMVASRLGLTPSQARPPRGRRAEWRTQGVPDISPDWAGTHLLKAWRAVRMDALFEPWFKADAAHAKPFDPDELAPDRIALRHLALMRATAARPLLHACLDVDG